MDRNRKILIAILSLLVLSSILVTVDISLKMQGTRKDHYSISSPQVGPGIGIVRISGVIGFNTGEDSLFMDRGSEKIINRLQDFESDSRIRAVVIRLNSPGGTVAATQEIFQKVMKLRKKNIIMIASMGDVAASGAYYIASACNYIMANNGTITGSIGVITASPNLRGLFEKLGIKMNVIKSGRYKDILSSYRDISTEERELIQGLIDSSYRQFLKDVSLGRNMPISDIEPYADGRIFDGNSAVKNKLIDATGTFEDAIIKARKLAKLPEDSPIYDEEKSPIEQLFLKMENIFEKDSIALKKLNTDNINMIQYRYMP